MNNAVIKPFHLSFVVRGLDAVKAFYTDLLGCEIGRDNADWFDVMLFGHQITVHREPSGMPARAIDHFGPILDKETWLAVAEKCRRRQAQFEMSPTILNDGLENESGKFLIKDPAGNLLEFKYYNDFQGTFSI